MNNKVYLQNYGCQMNKLDTALVEASLKQAGFEITCEENSADIVVLNTCSVRQLAEQKVMSHLGNLKHLKESRPEIIVAVIGCMAQRMGEELLKHSAVNIVCGPAKIPQLAELIKDVSGQRKKMISVTDNIRGKPAQEETSELENFESVYDHAGKHLPYQAFVRAMRGCNNFCSYCIVPFVRGPEISRPPEVIIDQIKRLADSGVKQITLLGQTVNSYEYKTSSKTYCLADILESASDISGIEWIRFVTNYPHAKYFKEIINAMESMPKVCNYLHIPAQSGSDKILKAMNRHYTKQQYIELIQTARSIIPDISIVSDFIVGFPSETDEDFDQTADLIRQVKYRNCFVFKYSARPDTSAQKNLEDNISDSVKKQRNIELLAIQEKISDEYTKNFLDRTVTVLVNGLSKKPHLNRAENNDQPQLIARTAEDIIVVFNGSCDLTGSFVNVKITRTSPLTLFGELII